MPPVFFQDMKNMIKLKDVKFLIIYILSLMAGNLVIYGIDRIAVLKGYEAMTQHDFLVFNAVIIGLAVLVPVLMESKRFNNFLDKILS